VSSTTSENAAGRDRLSPAQEQLLGPAGNDQQAETAAPLATHSTPIPAIG